MTLLRIIISIVLFFIYFQNACIAQDTIKLSKDKLEYFAKYLMVNKEYHFAADEYRRLTILYPDDRKYFSNWLTASRFAGRFEEIKRSLKITTETPKDWVMEYALACIKADRFSEARTVIDEAKLVSEEKFALTASETLYGLDLLERNAKEVLPLESFTNMHAFHQDFLKLKYKSPLGAGIMSALIPGAGRVYTKDYSNGIFSIMFIGTTALQAYNRFKKNGSSSVGGWIYTGFAAGFYIGNIYGSVKSAKAFNGRLKKSLNEKTKNHISSLSY